MQHHQLHVLLFLRQELVRIEFYLEVLLIKIVHKIIEVVLELHGEQYHIDIVIHHIPQLVFLVDEVVRVMLKQELVMMEYCHEVILIVVVVFLLVQIVTYEVTEHYLIDDEYGHIVQVVYHVDEVVHKII